MCLLTKRDNIVLVTQKGQLAYHHKLEQSLWLYKDLNLKKTQKKENHLSLKETFLN